MIKNSSKFYLSWLAVILIIAGLLCGSLFAVQQVGRNHANEWKAEAMEAGYTNMIHTICHGTVNVKHEGKDYIQLKTGLKNKNNEYIYKYYLIPADTKTDYRTDILNSIVILADNKEEQTVFNNRNVTILNTYGVTYTAIQAEMVLFIILTLATPPMIVVALYLLLFGFVKRNEEKANLQDIECDYQNLKCIKRRKT